MLHTDEMKDYILSNLDENNTFTKTYSMIARDLNLNVNIVRLTILDIVKSGMLTVETPPVRGRNSNPIYKIKSHMFELTETHPIEIGDEETKTIIFQGVEIILKLVDNAGYCMELSDMAMCILDSPITLSKIISSNKELFDGHLFTIDEKTYVDRVGAMTILLKINVDKILLIKKNLMVEFQSTVINILCASQLKAKLHIGDNQRITLRSNLNCILQLDNAQVEEMLLDLEGQISKTLDGCLTTNVKCRHDVDRLSKDNTRLQNRIESEHKSKEILVTENRQLREQLLSRGN